MGIAMVISFAFQGLGRATTPLFWIAVRVVSVVSASVIAVSWLHLDDSAVFALVAIGNGTSAAVMTVPFLRTERQLADSPIAS